MDVALEIIETFDKLRLFGVSCLDACVFCNNEEETLSHFFSNCSFSKELWLTFIECMSFVAKEKQTIYKRCIKAAVVAREMFHNLDITTHVKDTRLHIGLLLRAKQWRSC